MRSEVWPKVPRQVAAKFFYWKQQVEEHGLELVKKIPGYHDEPLEGKLRGYCRSARMDLGYRVYYRVVGLKVKCVLVEEVNRHDLLCLDPALEDHHVVGQDSQTHVTLATGGRFSRQGIALIALDHRVACFNLPSARVPASLSRFGCLQ